MVSKNVHKENIAKAFREIDPAHYSIENIFVTQGAQTTIMSAACAERCHIMRLVDTRWAGVAKGVGVQRIIGRIHMVQIQIGNDHLTTSFSVLEEQPMDMLLGLDMLKRHQCCIDLKKNVLKIGTTGTETPFLAEGLFLLILYN